MSRVIRVFPRKTKASPVDDLARFGPPDLFDQADEVHISTAFTYDTPIAERLAEQWRHVAPVKMSGPAEIQPGWNVLDDNLLACPRPHVEAVFAMLRKQGRRISFTGGLEALALEDYQVELLAGLPAKPNCFFAYDPGDEFDTLVSAARRLLEAGFTRQSHRLRCYVLIGYPKDTFDLALKRLQEIRSIGFTPMAMLWQPETPSQMKWAPPVEWRAFQRRWVRPTIIHARAA